MIGPDDPDDDDTLAAEYVLHLLDAPDRQAFEDRLQDDSRLRALVQDWEARLAPLADEVEEVQPSASVKAAILQRLDPPPPKSIKRGWFLGLAGLATAAMIAVIVLGPAMRGPDDLSPKFQAELTSEDGGLILVAGVIPATHEIVIDRVAGAAPEGRALELWLIAAGADAPVSLGVLASEGPTRIRVPDEIAPGVRTGTIAISEEPPGGSPTGAPTGAILATATFRDI